MDLTKKLLPSAIEVDGRFYEIKTDFQFILSLLHLLKMQEVKTFSDIEFIFVSKKPRNLQKAVDALIAFIYPETELPRKSGEASDDILFDFFQDGDIIYSSFFHYYNIDLFDENLHLHWQKFLVLFNGLKDTLMNDIINYRSYKIDSKDPQNYRKQMLKMKAMWEIIPELTEAEKKAIDDFQKLIY